MPYPSKQNKLYTALLQEIEAQYLPGSQLPPERILAEQYGVARMTLRKTLEQLVFEKRIQKKPRGIFVTDPDTGMIPNEEKGKAAVHVLFPCAQIYSAAGKRSYWLFREMLRGATTATNRYGGNVATVPVSDSTNKKDLKWKERSRLRKNDIVLIAGDWYRHLFSTLMKQGCKIGLIINGLETVPKILRSSPSCRIINRIVLANYLPEVLEHLSAGKGKRILLFLVKNNSLLSCFLKQNKKKQALDEARQAALPAELEIYTAEKNVSFEQQCTIIRKLYRMTPFDALIFDGIPAKGTAASLHQKCALPDTMPVYVQNGELLNGTKSQLEHVFYTRTPFLEYAEKLTEHFLSGEKILPDNISDFKHAVMDVQTAWQDIRRTEEDV